jgi:hypothetical protein
VPEWSLREPPPLLLMTIAGTALCIVDRLVLCRLATSMLAADDGDTDTESATVSIE